MEIRYAIPDDAEALSQIAIKAKAHWGYPENLMKVWRPTLTFSPEYFNKNESWVAEVDNQPIAFYTLQENAGTAWIENLWVLPEYIGQGVGRQLFLHALSRARELGYKILQLEADPNAAGFYEKMGMSKIGQRRSEADGQPRVLPIMEIDL
ncbi:MAG: GNAT family N-acetyltransferase [Chloroflexota bacterium]|nr:GNAT family N-acetyltransferase [Chloroflexota bacterium]